MAKSRKVVVSHMMPLFPEQSGWHPPKEPPNLDGVGHLAVDCETHDPELMTMGPGFLRNKAHTVGVAFAAKDAQWYFPLRHAIENCTWDVSEWLRDELMRDRCYIFANAQYDIEALWSMNSLPHGSWVDILVDQALIDEEFAPGYSLDAVATRWLGVGKADEILLKNAMPYGAQSADEAKGMMRYLPASVVGEYAETDARRTYDTHFAQEEFIIKEELDDVVELERHIIPVAWQMRQKGIRFNIDAAERLNKQWLLKENALIINMKATGYVVDPWSSKSIATYCDKKDIHYPRTPKGNPSFMQEFFSYADPMLKLVGQYRLVNKMRRDFIIKWLEFSEYDGRIHSRWHQVASEEGGTRSGRFASSDPNLQQVPVRNPTFGPQLRALFLPEEGEQFMKGDYSGQEIRVAIHYAYVLKCTGAAEIVARYHKDRNFDFHDMVAKMAGIERVDAKTLALGSLYGMQAGKAQTSVGLSPAQAKQAYEDYFRVAPYFRELSEIATNQANKKGFVKTFCGRRRRFKEKEFTHKALNSVVQGTSADMVKQAMINIWQQTGLIPLLQVHDELDYSVPDQETADKIKDLMESALELAVPMLIETKLGENWA